ncbi:apolipoprotein F [Patagioenas fasciata]|uniref:apolipoprotein F n=1 Tax=Patagioenas fasciata TaxID=372321 RepID=UPI003A9A49DA
MAQHLLFLLLLGSSPLSAAPAAPGDDDGAAVRALLAQLTEDVPPRALPGHGVSCQDLRPESLPGFSRLPPAPRALSRAAMALALSAAACAPQAEAAVLGLYREIGDRAAAALLRGLARLQDAPAPPALTLLLNLARPGGSATESPCVAAPGAPGNRTRTQLCRRVPRRWRREDGDPCAPPGEQEAHRVLEWVPGVSTFYNLGTSIYFAFQGCDAEASARALELAEDLGYAGLAALAGAVGGPVGLGVQLGLQPGLKAGVRALIGYFTAEQDPPPAPTAHSGPVLII